VTVIATANEAHDAGLTHVTPCDLFSDAAASVADPAVQTDLGWYVLHTRSRQEKALAEQLHKFSIEHFLPLVEIERQYGHRRRLVERPLFPSYVFMRGTREDRAQALTTNRIANVLEVQDQVMLARELQQVRAAIAAGVTLDPYAFLHVGHWVRVRSGPLMGLEGRVEDRRKAHRLVLQVEVLGQATSLEIDAELLEPMD
jgi:transcription antitermination factor NusG